MRSLAGCFAGVALLAVFPWPGGAQAPGGARSADTAASMPVVVFDPARDSLTVRAADSLDLSPSQRKMFFEGIAAAVAAGLTAAAADGQSMIDSARAFMVRETVRKLRFVRAARLLFSDMYARRARDPDRAQGTEAELWRSQRNVDSLIALYRRNPDASEFEMERAMAPAFRRMP